MIVYRYRGAPSLLGFDDPVGEVPILGRTLMDVQNDAFQRVGWTVRDVDSDAELNRETCVTVSENLYMSPEACRRVAERIRSGADSFRLVLEMNSFNQRYVLPLWTEYQSLPLTYVKNGSFPRDDWALPQTIFEHSVRLPRSVTTAPDYHLDTCAEVAGVVENPFQLLWLNIATNLNRTIPLSKRQRGWAKTLVPDFGRLYYFALRSINRIGRGCRIHPTAVLEGVELGDNVTVGAYAVLRLSTIASGCTIEDHASITYSVLGENNLVANGNHVNFCLTYEDVFLIHGPYQFSVYGRQTAVFATINCDTRMDTKTIRMPYRGGFVDSGQPFLGIAYGHGCKISGGNIIYPGRIIPNGTVMEPPYAAKTAAQA